MKASITTVIMTRLTVWKDHGQCSLLCSIRACRQPLHSACSRTCTYQRQKVNCCKMQPAKCIFILMRYPTALQQKKPKMRSTVDPSRQLLECAVLCGGCSTKCCTCMTLLQADTCRATGGSTQPLSCLPAATYDGMSSSHSTHTTAHSSHISLTHPTPELTLPTTQLCHSSRLSVTHLTPQLTHLTPQLTHSTPASGEQTILTHIKSVVLYGEQLGLVGVCKAGAPPGPIDVFERQCWWAACQPQSLHMLRDHPAARVPHNGVIPRTGPSSASVSDVPQTVQ